MNKDSIINQYFIHHLSISNYKPILSQSSNFEAPGKPSASRSKDLTTLAPTAMTKALRTVLEGADAAQIMNSKTIGTCMTCIRRRSLSLGSEPQQSIPSVMITSQPRDRRTIASEPSLSASIASQLSYSDRPSRRRQGASRNQ